MRNRTHRKKCHLNMREKFEIAYKKYLKDLYSLGLKYHKPITFEQFEIFKSWHDLNRNFKRTLARRAKKLQTKTTEGNVDATNGW